MPRSPKNKTPEAAISGSTAKKASASKTSPSKKTGSPKKKKHTSKPTHYTVGDSLDILVPTSLGNNAGECTVLVELQPDDAALLDFEGSTGAIGRFQVDSEGIVLDLKGSQYRGSLLPGPTVMMASLQYSAATGENGKQQQQQLRLETIVDEFCPLDKTQDTMKILDGHVEGTMDASYQLQEEDVNILARQEAQQQNKQQKQTEKNATKAKNNSGGKTAPKKRTSTGSTTSKSSKATTTTGNKRQKVSLGRKKWVKAKQ